MILVFAAVSCSKEILFLKTEIKIPRGFGVEANKIIFNSIFFIYKNVT